MLQKHIYTTPDYFPAFRCKMGACRHSCCEGWPVSISLSDYYRLLGEEVSPRLRQKIDSALHLHKNPTEDEYAFIAHDYLGNCPMRLEDGRCGLHAEAGEQALSFVCRLYPRGVREEGDYECSCANSCEAVIEAFLDREDKLTFIKKEFSFDLPEQKTRSVYFETLGREQELRLYFIRLLQDRSLPLPQRFLSLADALDRVEELTREKDEAGISALLSADGFPRPAAVFACGPDKLSQGLSVADRMMEAIDERSDSVRSYGQETLAAFEKTEDPLGLYEASKARFESLLPNHENAFEHMLVNHMFFERFPFQDRPLSLYDEFIALCACYTLLRFLCVGRCADPAATQADIADVCAAAFRLVDHTSFDRFAVSLFRRMEFTGRDQLFELISL